MQVYFLDNEDFFKRKSVFEDDKGQPFEDNADRMIFFCKGVIETVKKFGWAPDIIHCHGWMTSLIPLYLKTAYKTEPLFKNSSIIYSLYDKTLSSAYSDEFTSKASINNLEPEDLIAYKDGDSVALHKGATTFSDAVITGSENLAESFSSMLTSLEKPVLDFKNEEEYLPAYLEFYNSLLEQEVQ